MKSARISSTGRGDVRLPVDPRFDVYRKRTISLNDVGTPRNLKDRHGDDFFQPEQPALIIVGRLTAYDEYNAPIKLYGEFQMHDNRVDERYQAPCLKLQYSDALMSVLAEFDAAQSGPLFFGLKVFEEQGSIPDWRFERFEL